MLKQRSSTLSFESLFTIHNSLFPVLLQAQDRKAPILRMTLKSGHFWPLLLKKRLWKAPKTESLFRKSQNLSPKNQKMYFQNCRYCCYCCNEIVATIHCCHKKLLLRQCCNKNMSSHMICERPPSWAELVGQTEQSDMAATLDF